MRVGVRGSQTFGGGPTQQLVVPAESSWHSRMRVTIWWTALATNWAACSGNIAGPEWRKAADADSNKFPARGPQCDALLSWIEYSHQPIRDFHRSISPRKRLTRTNGLPIAMRNLLSCGD